MTVRLAVQKNPFIVETVAVTVGVTRAIVFRINAVIMLGTEIITVMATVTED
jgi:hypothetical protein